MFNLKLAGVLVTSVLVQLSMPSAHAMTDSELSGAMRNDIKKYLTTVKSPKLIFHWVDSSDINPPGQYNTQYPSIAPHFRDYVAKQGRRVYNRRISGDNDIAGPGLYMAAGPIVSRSYGGQKSFGLIVGLIKPGSKILGSLNSGLPLHATIASEVTKRGCRENDYANIIDTYDAACVKVKQILVGSDISFADGRIYSWSNDTMDGCKSMNPVRDLVIPTSKVREYEYLNTFVAYNPNLFSAVFGYTHKSVNSGNQMADAILAYLKGLETQGLYNGLISKAQMSNPAIKAMGPNDMKKFSQQFILGCVQ